MTGRASGAGAGVTGPISGGSRRDLRFWSLYFGKLLAISYLLMRFIIYGTKVLAYYFVHGVWKFL